MDTDSLYARFCELFREELVGSLLAATERAANRLAEETGRLPAEVIPADEMVAFVLQSSGILMAAANFRNAS